MMIYTPPVENPNVVSVIRKKYLVWMEESDTVTILIGHGRIAATVIVVLSVMYWQEALTVAAFLWVHGWRVLLAVCLTECFFRRKKILRFFRRQWNGRNQYTLEGVPKSELLHHLFESDGLLMESTMEKFGMSRKAFDRLARKLEKLGVLVRGPNNARVLSAAYSREELAEMIESATEAADIGFSVRFG